MKSKLISNLLIIILLIPFTLAGSICEGVECILLVLVMLLYQYGWIVGIILITVSLVLIFYDKKNKRKLKKIYLIMIVIGLLLINFIIVEIINEKKSLAIGHKIAVESAKNLNYNIYIPTNLPPNNEFSRINVYNKIITFTIKKINYDSSLPGTQIVWGKIYEQKSTNINKSMCWKGYNSYAPCKKISVLNDGTEVFIIPKPSFVTGNFYGFYIKKSETDIYLDPSIQLALNENIQDRQDIIKIIESLTLITSEELSKLIR